MNDSGSAIAASTRIPVKDIDDFEAEIAELRTLCDVLDLQFGQTIIPREQAAVDILIKILKEKAIALEEAYQASLLSFIAERRAR